VTLDKLILKNIKGVEDCTLDFHKNTNLVLGRNGTGKTLLLELIADAINKKRGPEGRSDRVLLFPEHFSPGRQRYVKESIIENDIIIAEHITGKIHWSYLDEFIQLLSAKQCFLETHDSELINRMHFKSSNEIQRKIVICCQTANHENKSVVKFRNLNNTEAEDVFNSYQAGIQHFSEILKTHEIW
jgi:predicted ATP-dependent endonuclease of OLD family